MEMASKKAMHTCSPHLGPTLKQNEQENEWTMHSSLSHLIDQNTFTFFLLIEKQNIHLLHSHCAFDWSSLHPPCHWLSIDISPSFWSLSKRTLKHCSITEACQPQLCDHWGKIDKKHFLHETLFCTTCNSNATIPFTLMLHCDTKSAIAWFLRSQFMSERTFCHCLVTEATTITWLLKKAFFPEKTLFVNFSSVIKWYAHNCKAHNLEFCAHCARLFNCKGVVVIHGSSCCVVPYVNTRLFSYT